MKRKVLLFLMLCGLLILPQSAFAGKKQKIKQAFGMNMHIRQRVSESDWEEVMDQAEEAGVQWGREEFRWDTIEPSDDSFSWNAYDSVVDQYEAHGIKMVGLLTYSSEWANPKGEFYPPDTTAWKDYVGTVAKRYKGRVDYWEIWNEPNHEGFWKGTTKEYATLIEAASDTITAKNPDAKIVLGGLSGADTDFLDELYTELNNPSVIDVVAIHPYRTSNGGFNASPEKSKDGLNTLRTDILNIKSIVRRHDKKNTPIWLTEIGWPTHTDGVSEKEQAQYLMRTYTAALTIPQVKKLFWYSFNDTSSDKTDAESNFGIVDVNYKKKKAFSAYSFTKKHLTKAYLKKNQPILLGTDGTEIDNFQNGINGWEVIEPQCTNSALAIVGEALKIIYSFTADSNCFAPIVRDKLLPTNARAIIFRAKGYSDDTTLRVRFTDAKGEIFQYTLGYLPDQWLNYTVNFSDYSTSWNGDGKKDYPFTLQSFILDDKDGSRANGMIYIDWIQASSIANTQLIRLHKGKKDLYAYWTNVKAKQRQLVLSGVKKLRIERWKASNKRKKRSHTLYKIKAAKSLKFLQEL